MDKLGFIEKCLREKGYSEEKISDIVDLIRNVFKRGKFTVYDLLIYAEKTHQKKYGDDEVFFSRPVPASLKIKFSQFRLEHKIEVETFKKFITWVIDYVPKKYSKRASVYDLHSKTLFSIFVKQSQNFNESGGVKKESISKKRIIAVK